MLRWGGAGTIWATRKACSFNMSCSPTLFMWEHHSIRLGGALEEQERKRVESAHLNSPLGHMTQEGQVAQNVERHGCAPDGALARQAPLPVIYRTARVASS